jgi:hypothetical protein
MKIYKGLKFLILLVILFSFLGCFFVLAAEQGQGKSLEISYPKSPFSGIEISGTKTPLPVFIKYIFEFSVFFVLCISILLLVFAGFKYITSMGNPAAAKDAKERIESAVLGIAIVFFAFLILNTVDPDLLKSRFIIPKLNLSTKPLKIEEIKSITNFQQIPISYLILNRFLGMENYIANKTQNEGNEGIEQLEIKQRKIANDRFGQNRLDNIYNELGKNVLGKNIFIPDTEQKQKYHGVSAYTKILAQKIEEKTKKLKEELGKCHCGGPNTSCTNNPWQFKTGPTNSSAGWWMDNGACEKFPCGTQPCDCGSSYSCKSHCQCYGEPCPNRKELRQLQTDLEVLVNAFEVYVDGNQWISDWVKKENGCFEKGVCKKFEQMEDCHSGTQCYTWSEEKYNITEDTKKFIYQMAKTEQEYGGLGEVIDDLVKQKDQIIAARGDIYYGSKFYWGTTPFGFFWSEPFYKFVKSGLDEHDNLFQIDHENWKETKNDLMSIKDEKNAKIMEENKKLCEEELKGSWSIIAEGIKPEELSLKAVCNYKQEFKSSEYSKDYANNWVIFYKNINSEQGILENKSLLLDLIPSVSAFSFGCNKGQSTSIPIGDTLSNTLGFIEKLVNNLDNKKPANVDRRAIIGYIMAKKKLPTVQNEISQLVNTLDRWYQYAADITAKGGDAHSVYADIEKSKEKRDLEKKRLEEASLQKQIKGFEEAVKKYNFNDLDIKEIANYIILDVRTIINAVNETKGSNCQTELIEDTREDCCGKICPGCESSGDCSDGESGCSDEKSQGFLDKFIGFLKINSVRADCRCPDDPCPPCGECSSCVSRKCPYCSSCTAGHCESCSGEPYPQLLLPSIELISFYNNQNYDGIGLNPEFVKLTFDYYTNELDNLINKPQQWESGPATYVEKINSDLKKSAENFSSTKFCDSFPVIGSKDYEAWKDGTLLTPMLIDKNMAASTYGIHEDQWKELVGNENNFYCCLPYEAK